jgi:serine/threonine protein kinase
VSKSIEAFGKYMLLERLAAGGMAEVYLAKSLGASGIGKFVAIKRILPQFSDNEEFINMFKEEAKLVMNLNHGNVVSIYDFGIERHQFFLVMEFVEGQNLRQTLNHLKKVSKSFSLDQIVYLIKEVAAGLDHAHRCIDASTGRQLNITHRDMSPQNVMVTFEGEVKVVDFGIAKAETQIEHTRSGTIKGKFGYMSPEQAEGQVVDARTDIFSLGIVLWELLANDRLFAGQSEHATLKKIKECQIPSIRKLNPSVPPELERIVNKALMKERNLRYQSAEFFSKDLNKFLNTQFPDFSKQEFSKFMKQVFQDMYLENRKKLAEYAKIEVSDARENTLTDTSTEIGTEVGESSDEPSLKMEVAQSQRIDLSKLALDTGSNSKSGKSVSLAPRRTPTPGTMPGGLSGPPQQTQVRNGNYTNTQAFGTSTNIRVPPAKPSSKPSDLTVVLLVAASLCAGGFWYYTQKHGPRNEQARQQQVLQKMIDTASGEKYATQQILASKTGNLVPLKLESTPSGAQVFIDDKLIGKTPVISHVESGRPFKLRVVREGYMPSEMSNELASAEGYSNSIVMMPEPQNGYISIDGPVPPNQPVVVIVNGQKTNAKALPFAMQVPAGIPISVTVVSPLQKLEGSETVIVDKGQTKKVLLKIDKPAHILE